MARRFVLGSDHHAPTSEVLPVMSSARRTSIISTVALALVGLAPLSPATAAAGGDHPGKGRGKDKALDLTVLKDDKEFFPKYNVAPVLTKAVVDEYPAVVDLFGPVTKKLTDDVLIDLNAQVDVDGKDPADVAFAWLTDEGFIKE